MGEGLDLHLARNFNVSVVGINLSDEQVRVCAPKRAAVEALPCEFSHRRLSDHLGQIRSQSCPSECFEHVGKQHYHTFFAKLPRNCSRTTASYCCTPSGRWDGPSEDECLGRALYLLPGRLHAPHCQSLPPRSSARVLIISDVEVLRLHYAETLRALAGQFSLPTAIRSSGVFEGAPHLKQRFGNRRAIHSDVGILPCRIRGLVQVLWPRGLSNSASQERGSRPRSRGITRIAEKNRSRLEHRPRRKQPNRNCCR